MVSNDSGLLEQIKSNDTIYKPFTLKDIDDFLSSYKEPETFVIYTGMYGMMLFDLCFAYGISENVFKEGYSWYIPSRVRKNCPIIVNIGNKSGLYKAIARPTNFRLYKVEIRKGTEIIEYLDTFKEVFEKYGK